MSPVSKISEEKQWFLCAWQESLKEVNDFYVQFLPLCNLSLLSKNISGHQSPFKIQAVHHRGTYVHKRRKSFSIKNMQMGQINLVLGFVF